VTDEMFVAEVLLALLGGIIAFVVLLVRRRKHPGVEPSYPLKEAALAVAVAVMIVVVNHACKSPPPLPTKPPKDFIDRHRDAGGAPDSGN
jgi:hypothetical protein